MTQCKGTTTKGDRCKNQAERGSKYCYLHNTQSSKSNKVGAFPGAKYFASVGKIADPNSIDFYTSSQNTDKTVKPLQKPITFKQKLLTPDLFQMYKDVRLMASTVPQINGFPKFDLQDINDKIYLVYPDSMNVIQQYKLISDTKKRQMFLMELWFTIIMLFAVSIGSKILF